MLSFLFLCPYESASSRVHVLWYASVECNSIVSNITAQQNMHKQQARQLHHKKLKNQKDCSRLEQRSFIKVLVAEKCKPHEIYWRIHDMYQETCFSQKIFANGQNMGLPLWAWVEKTVYGVETHWLFGKEKIPGTAVSKEGHADNLLKNERSFHHYWFSWIKFICKQYFLLPTS